MVSLPCEAERLTTRYSSDAPVPQNAEYNERDANGSTLNGYSANGYDGKSYDGNDCMSDVDGDGGGPHVVTKQQEAFDPEDQGMGWRDVEM